MKMVMAMAVDSNHRLRRVSSSSRRNFASEDWPIPENALWRIIIGTITSTRSAKTLEKIWKRRSELSVFFLLGRE